MYPGGTKFSARLDGVSGEFSADEDFAPVRTRLSLRREINAIGERSRSIRRTTMVTVYHVLTVHRSYVIVRTRNTTFRLYRVLYLFARIC